MWVSAPVETHLRDRGSGILSRLARGSYIVCDGILRIETWKLELVPRKPPSLEDVMRHVHLMYGGPHDALFEPTSNLLFIGTSLRPYSDADRHYKCIWQWLESAFREAVAQVTANNARSTPALEDDGCQEPIAGPPSPSLPSSPLPVPAADSETTPSQPPTVGAAGQLNILLHPAMPLNPSAVSAVPIPDINDGIAARRGVHLPPLPVPLTTLVDSQNGAATGTATPLFAGGTVVRPPAPLRCTSRSIAPPGVAVRSARARVHVWQRRRRPLARFLAITVSSAGAAPFASAPRSYAPTSCFVADWGDADLALDQALSVQGTGMAQGELGAGYAPVDAQGGHVAAVRQPTLSELLNAAGYMPNMTASQGYVTELANT
ncbi:hypothetical protein N658DRAFT_552026 [Parathielavia hyrcaniae]|uniref:Uncharacterized protein n=1 Tax=Parathielavia hyrcaniae TaxID=113614 RepID=A0AAN6PRT6_9PEZI|nr:hypothetical protein N658DRAFT_552026 [Parathielavia hyrcaniae]